MIEQHPRVAGGSHLQFLGREDELVVDLLDRRAPGEVGMGIDHAGHQRAAPAIDDKVGCDIACRQIASHYGGNPLAIDQHSARERRTATAVEYADIADECPHLLPPRMAPHLTRRLP